MNERLKKPRLCISFSGGRTSAVMTKLCVEQHRETHEIVVTFANTGCEHENTLKFVDQCDKHFGWGVVWLEAVVNPEYGKGITHKVVDYEMASRYGEPFEEHAKKYGIPGPGWGHCTRDLKDRPIRHYIKELGWEFGSYWTAIGIRADEFDRMSSRRRENRLIYPLVKAGWTKEDIKAECSKWPFDLELKGEHWGNCVWCWKKSLRKLMTLSLEDESVFDFPRKLEAKYSQIFPPKYDEEKKQKYLFREKRTVADIIELAKTVEFEPYHDLTQTLMFSEASHELRLDIGGGCGDSCEIGVDD